MPFFNSPFKRGMKARYFFAEHMSPLVPEFGKSSSLLSGPRDQAQSAGRPCRDRVPRTDPGSGSKARPGNPGPGNNARPPAPVRQCAANVVAARHRGSHQRAFFSPPLPEVHTRHPHAFHVDEKLFCLHRRQRVVRHDPEIHRSTEERGVKRWPGAERKTAFPCRL